MPKKDESDRARSFLAISITVVSVLAVVTLGWVSIAKDGTKAEQVLSETLPLLGTWVGTVLAYYFSRENFASASRSVADMARQLTTSEKLASLAAKDRMIPNDPKILLSKTEPASGIVLKDLLAKLRAAKKGQRVPVFDSTGKMIRAIVHSSLIDRFLAEQAIEGRSKTELESLSLENLLGVPDMKRIAESFAVIREGATLADAKKAMADMGNDCQDVFVTKGGGRTDEVLGWITNVIIEDNSTV